MRKRKLGATGLEVSELALGTWGLSGDGYGPVEEAEQDAVIDRALALGITLFETADTYAGGEMERRLGRRLAKASGALIATKIGTNTLETVPRRQFDKAFLKEAAERSRERIGRERIDILLLHNPSAWSLKQSETAEAMAELVQAGIVGTWGVSVGTPEAAAEAVSIGAPVIQLPHNAFRRRELELIAADVKEKKIGILARSVLSYGLLCGAWPQTKEFDKGDHRADRWSADELRRRIVQLNALRPSVLGPVTSLRAAAIRYVLAEPTVSSAVLGPRKTTQLDQLIRDAGKPPYLLPDGRVHLENRVRAVGVEP